jgi:hypothetical protein
MAINPQNRHQMSRMAISQIFDDLDRYRSFCVEYGRVFNEADLYNTRNRDYNDYMWFLDKGTARNHWKGEHLQERKPYQGNNNNGRFQSNRNYQHQPRRAN